MRAAGVEASVEMVMTTSTPPLPMGGGTGLGVKLHCAPVGSPPEQESATGLLNDVPTGSTITLYGPVVCPATTVWLLAEEITVTAKSGTTVSAIVKLWLGVPVVSWVLMLML